jgi:hypothetical protein
MQQKPGEGDGVDGIGYELPAIKPEKAGSYQRKTRDQDKNARNPFRSRILPASLTGSRFYRETFSPAQWNQDFTKYLGEGVTRSGQLSVVSEPKLSAGSWGVRAKTDPSRRKGA